MPGEAPKAAVLGLGAHSSARASPVQPWEVQLTDISPSVLAVLPLPA